MQPSRKGGPVAVAWLLALLGGIGIPLQSENALCQDGRLGFHLHAEEFQHGYLSRLRTPPRAPVTGRLPESPVRGDGSTASW